MNPPKSYYDNLRRIIYDRCKCDGIVRDIESPKALRLVFDDIANVSSLVPDINSVSDWNAFMDLPNLGGVFTSVKVNGNEVKLYGGSNIKVKPAIFYNVYNTNNISLLEIDDQAGCITAVGGDAFNYCYYLTDVNLPECTIIYSPDDSPQNDYGAFGECTSLVNLNMPKLITAGTYAFVYCTSLTAINLPNLTTTGDWCFQNCTSLTTINLPNLTTSEDYCFQYCTALTTIDLPNLTTAGDYCFYGCTSLTTINFNNLTTAGYSCFQSCASLITVYSSNLINVGILCFSGCTALTTIDLPNLTTAGDSCFSECFSLTTINLPNLISAGSFCFHNCTSLTSLNFTNLTNAEYGCFYGCTALTTINLPNLTTAGDYCFSECTALTTITLPSCITLGTTTADDNVFHSISGNTITLTVPSTLMTCNGGNPDGDIQYLQANNTVTVITV